MPAESMREICNVELRQAPDASNLLLDQCRMDLPKTGLEERRAVAERQTQNLKEAGILPELALGDSRICIETPPGINERTQIGAIALSAQKGQPDARSVSVLQGHATTQDQLYPLAPIERAVNVAMPARQYANRSEDAGYDAPSTVGQVKDNPTPPLKGAIETAVKFHEVKKGETLWGICKEHLREENGGKEPTDQEIYRKVREVAKLNGIKNPDRIYPGDMIELPCKQNQESPTKESEPDKPVTPEQPEVSKPDYATSELDYVKHRFDEIDTNKDSHITKNEIADFVEKNDKHLTYGESRALELVAEHVDGIQKQVEPESEDGPKVAGITRQDLEESEKRMKALEYARDHFWLMDTQPHDHHLTREEIDEYMEDRSELSVEDRASLAWLRSHVGELGQVSFDIPLRAGFSTKDVQMALEELGTRSLSEDDDLKLPVILLKD